MTALMSIQLVLPETQAFFKFIEWSEGVKHGYYSQYGGTKVSQLNTFPCKVVTKWGQSSSACGRYQILNTTYRAYQKKYSLKDFSPKTQDFIAYQLIRNKQHMNDPYKLIQSNKDVWTSIKSRPIRQSVDKYNIFLEELKRN